jgi:RNA polymerase sigma-70 factor (ECF subfamily)
MTADDVPAEAIQIAEAQRDPRRFGVLYENNFDAVYAFVARRVSDRRDAEDVTADVFHKALGNLHRFEWRGAPFAAWLYRIAANEISDRARRTGAAPALPDESEFVETRFDQVDQRATLFGLVRKLPDDQQRVVRMRFADDLKIKDIARELGRSEGAVKQLQLRALQTLRAGLGDVDE